MLEDRELTLRDYGRVVWRRKWIVAAAVLTALIGSLALSFMQDPIYAASAQMLVEETRSGDAVFQQDPTLNVQNIERAIQTEIQVLEGQRVRERVQTDLDLEELPPEASATAVNSTNVVRVTVRSRDPRTAQRLADAYVQAYIETRRDLARASLENGAAELQVKIEELQGQIDALPADAPQRGQLVEQLGTFNEKLDEIEIDAALTDGGASVLVAADRPTDPVEPTPLRTAMLAGVLGLLLGLGAAFLIDYLDDSVRHSDEIEALSGLPVLAVIPVEPPIDHRPIALSEPSVFAVEMYRGLRTSLQFLGLDKPMRVIQVTSALPGEGKTTTATNLAVVIAQAGFNAALIDADLRRPRVHEVFAVPLRPGLTDTLVADESVDMAVNHLDRLHVVAAGGTATNPSEIIASNRFASVVKELATRCHFVIIDSPPVLPVADALALSRLADGVLVVGQAGRTTKRTMRECFDKLRHVGAPLVGVVLNRAARGSSQEYGYGYGYNYDAPGVSAAAARPAPPSGAVSPASRRDDLADTDDDQATAATHDAR